MDYFDRLGTIGGIHIYFKSKKDVFYSSLLWGGIALAFFTIVYPSVFNLSISNLIGFILGLIIIGWLILIWFGTGYRVENNTLNIQGGPFKQTVDIQKIKKITKEKSVVTSAALAIDRLLIHYGNYKYASISPKDEYEFIKVLLSKNPQIQIDEALTTLYKI